MKNLKKYLLSVLVVLSLLTVSIFGMGDACQGPIEGPRPGMVVVINGTSSSGKSSISRRLRNLIGHDVCEYLAIDELRFDGLDIDELDDDEYSEFERAYDGNKDLSLLNNYLCSQAINEANKGKVVICDTVLCGEADKLNAFKQKVELRGLRCCTVLVYCSLFENLERVEHRNSLSREDEMRSPFQPLAQYQDMYSSSPGLEIDLSLDFIGRPDLERACSSPVFSGKKGYRSQEMVDRLEGVYSIRGKSNTFTMPISPREQHDIVVKNSIKHFIGSRKDRMGAGVIMSCARSILSFIDGLRFNCENTDNTFRPIDPVESSISTFRPIVAAEGNFGQSSDDDDDDDIVFGCSTGK